MTDELLKRASGAPGQTPEELASFPIRTVRIPACDNHEGLYAMNVRLRWVCPKCGGPRGQIENGLSYDGSLYLAVNKWKNPCGHIDKYDAVRNEAKENQLNDLTIEELKEAWRTQAPVKYRDTIYHISALIYRIDDKNNTFMQLELRDKNRHSISIAAPCDVKRINDFSRNEE